MVSVGFSGSSAIKNTPAMQEMQETQIQFLGREDPLEEGMATHSSIPSWRIPLAQEPGGPKSIGSQSVGHDWSDWACMHKSVAWFKTYKGS